MINGSNLPIQSIIYASDYWYDFITRTLGDWINTSAGPNPNRTDEIYADGGLNKNISALDAGNSDLKY